MIYSHITSTFIFAGLRVLNCVAAGGNSVDYYVDGFPAWSIMAAFRLLSRLRRLGILDILLLHVD